jgi:hypothetical protein
MINQTLAAISVPINAPSIISMLTDKCKKYNKYKPVKNVNAAAHLKYHKALGTSFWTTSDLAEGSDSLKYSVWTKLK